MADQLVAELAGSLERAQAELAKERRKAAAAEAAAAASLVAVGQLQDRLHEAQSATVAKAAELAAERDAALAQLAVCQEEMARLRHESGAAHKSQLRRCTELQGENERLEREAAAMRTLLQQAELRGTRKAQAADILITAANERCDKHAREATAACTALEDAKLQLAQTQVREGGTQLAWHRVLCDWTSGLSATQPDPWVLRLPLGRHRQQQRQQLQVARFVCPRRSWRG